MKIQTLPILEQWDCHSCGQCCKGHTVILDAEDLQRIESQRWHEIPEYQSVKVVLPYGWLRRRHMLAQRADGSCVFLAANGYCKVHELFGEAAKPWACRMFPFQLIPFDGQVLLTMRRNCPSAAANNGRPIAEHLPAAKALAHKALPQGATIAPPRVIRRAAPSWADARIAGETIGRMMLDQQYPMIRRLVHAVRFCELLAETAPGKLTGAGLKELAVIYDKTALQQAGEWFRDRLPPSRAGGLLFRQAAAEYARYHPNVGARPTLANRFRMFRSALTIARGAGQVPRIHPDLPATTFAELERPLGCLPAEVMQPISNYYEAMTASWQFCGAGRFGWSIVDGVRAMALGYAVGLWLLRWISTGRQPTTADAIQVVCMLDWSHYYPLLSGARHRKRLDVLSTLGDLNRLLVWFAR